MRGVSRGGGDASRDRDSREGGEKPTPRLGVTYTSCRNTVIRDRHVDLYLRPFAQTLARANIRRGRTEESLRLWTLNTAHRAGRNDSPPYHLARLTRWRSDDSKAMETGKLKNRSGDSTGDSALLAGRSSTDSRSR
ncbi:hypothetical protein ALC60_08517 [Trachymyrmex zeteki]|uniref:Uncharacterized protein n=1 Tax=Mycetomoellerius zeteki TaxID=64791 RepID=A0A151WWR7_9HYME|nr:hypothetical protein ALC60_08517 [Trachymyrmex zeteki]